MKSFRTSLLFYCLTLLLSLTRCQLLSVSLPGVSHITTGGDKVFASTGSRIYCYSTDLVQQQSVSQEDIVGLSATPDGQWVVACITTGPCYVLNGSDISVTVQTEEDVYGNTGSADGLTLFTATVSGGQSFYAGSYGGINNEMGDRIRFNEYGFAGSTIERNSIRVPLKGFGGRLFYGGFTFSDYAYYVVVDPDTSVTQQLRIVRVCRNESIQSQYELQLVCSSKLVDTVVRGVSVINNKTLVIGLTASTSGGGDGNGFCSYNMSDINSLMDGVYQSCVAMEDGDKNVGWIGLSDQSCTSGFKDNPTPCDFNDDSAPVAIAPSNSLSSTDIPVNSTVLGGIRASLGLTVDNIDLIYVGFTTNNKYYLDKYHLVGGSLDLIEEVQIADSAVSDSEEVSITASEDTQFVFLTSVGQIVGLPIENCSRAVSCDECVSLRDPLCGWCVFEGKCSRSSSCMDSESTGRYLSQGEGSSCFDSVTIEPSEYIRDLEEIPNQVSVNFVPAFNAPRLPGEELFCVFSNEMMNIEVKAILEMEMCSVEEVIGQLSGVSLSTEFAVFSNRTNVKFFISDDPFVFYDCGSVSKCSECVQAAGVCGWCLLDFTCTGDNTTCSGGTNNWLTINSGDSFSDVCPLLVPNNGGNYTQPVNVAENLALMTLNTPDDISGLTYECVFGSVTRPATRNSDTSVVCTIGDGQELQFTGGNTMTQTLDFTLRQINSSKSYSLETSTSSDINVVLYDCQSLASSCSQCLGQNINTGFKCGWCSSDNQCTVSSAQCSPSIITMSGGCEDPVITMIDPQSGPPRGNTTITIDGTNLGVVFSDIVSVTVGQRTCTSDPSQYSTGVRIICTINTGDNPVGTATVTVVISTSNGNKQATSQFMVLEPRIDSVTPGFGPVSGGTQVIIRGSNLDIGNKDNTEVLFREASGNKRRRKRQTCPQRECRIDGSTFNSTYLSCVSEQGGPSDCVMEVVVNIDSDEYDNDDVRFRYTPDPVFISLTPQDVIPIGGTTLTFTGTNLNVTQSPVMLIRDTRFDATQGPCSSAAGDSLVCIAPPITPAVINAIGTTIQYRVIVDGASGPNNASDDFQLTLRANPFVSEIRNREINLPQDATEVIRFGGNNLIPSLRDDVNITVGPYNCPVNSIDAMEMTCQPAIITDEISLQVTVKIGQTLRFGNDSEQWRVSFVTTRSALVDAGVIGGGVAGGLVILLILFGIVVIFIVIKARSASRQKDMRFTKLMSDMERMELEMAVTCKTAFTELQTDLGELVTEEALESSQLPFQSFPTYATKIFFPHAGTDHPVLSPPRLPPNMTSESFATLMNEFRDMVLDKSFLTSFIRTLESQDRLTLHEKSTIASLLMVVSLQDVTYATEILQVLLGDLIRRSISQTRNHPKILLRRTESVAEKLLTNWFCVTLYPFLLETVGPPMFVLFKAVKAQLEKGPIDVINGEAKNSLSEEKLLRQSLEFKTIECEVEMGNANHLLARMKNCPSGVALEPANVGQEEIQTIKLLDADSISQTKEKLLDFIYRNRPVSQRPSINDIELELCRGNAGIPLRDQDSTSKKDGEWTRINTLGHYNIPEMAEAAIEDPKKSTPRFRLRSRSDRPLSVPSFDFPGTIIASASVTSQTSLLAAAQTFDASKNKMYHLVKPEIGGEGESKIVSEVFLTRLLSTKRILQPYVDDLFHAIFTMPHGKPLPRAIKVFFDFLDQIAAELNIADPDVLHIWKTNGLPLRFWVNLIKNPEFIFDINKSATIDACFTIIAQAYIDACSTSEVVYTKDTPSARLLYVKEVKNYKKEVLNYYSGVQSLPRITFEELRSHFKETLDPFFDEFEKHEGIHFHSDSALLELYRYAVQYGDSISETLSEDRLTMIAAQFNSLRQKFNVNSSPV